MLGIDQVDVNVTGIFYRFQDGTFGDFMEDDTSGEDFSSGVMSVLENLFLQAALPMPCWKKAFLY